MSAFVLSPAARNDLHAIWDYIAGDSIEAADGVIDDLREGMEKIASMPGIGSEHTELADETLRVWRVHSYLIIYRPMTQPLQIVRVVSGYRDVSALNF